VTYINPKGIAMKFCFAPRSAWLRLSLSLATGALLFGGGTAYAHEDMTTVSAELEATGMLKFKEYAPKVHITGIVSGLTPGKHGIHVHTNGNCDSPDAMSAGGHYSPYGGRHNAPTNPDRHLGDLGNIVAGPDGVANVDLVVEGMTLALIGTNSIIDRAIVIHANEDDFSDPTGNSGPRVACGIIDQGMMRM
jgi:Cu-Zn family superoxide dismutase